MRARILLKYRTTFIRLVRETPKKKFNGKIRWIFFFFLLSQLEPMTNKNVKKRQRVGGILPFFFFTPRRCFEHAMYRSENWQIRQNLDRGFFQKYTHSFHWRAAVIWQCRFSKIYPQTYLVNVSNITQRQDQVAGSWVWKCILMIFRPKSIWDIFLGI